MRDRVIFIPARKGNGKNMRELGGQPLLEWTILAALHSGIGHPWVSTDCPEAAKLAGDLGVHIHHRSEETAGDQASTESALLEFASVPGHWRHLVMVQPTSPFVRPEHIAEAFGHLENNRSVVSVVRAKKFRWDQLGPTNYTLSKRPRRQDWHGEFYENGAIYGTSRPGLLTSSCRVTGDAHQMVVGDGLADQIEIDDEADWELAEAVVARRGVGLFATDCDGVLTDGTYAYTRQGDRGRSFNTRDGAALARVDCSKLVISTDYHAATDARTQKLGVDYLGGCSNKGAALKRIRQGENLPPRGVAFIGDDLNDLPAFEQAFWTFAPADAHPKVRAAARVRLASRGGEGCVAEAIDLLEALGEL